MPVNDKNEHLYQDLLNPKCPFCDFNIDIDDNELFDLHEEDTHCIKCPECDLDIKVESTAVFRFSTIEQ